jgi:hypothetical protein
MLLMCFVDHQYGEEVYVAGNAYDVEDTLAMRLLRDFGPGSSTETRRGRPYKFDVTDAEPKAAGDAPVDVAPYEAPDLSGMTRAQLESFAAENNLAVNTSLTVAELRADLTAQLEARAQQPAQEVSP